MSKLPIIRFSAAALLLAVAWVQAPATGAQETEWVVAPDIIDGAYLGVRLTEEDEHPEGGARVTHVVDDSPADEAGIRPGDIIVEFDGSTIRGPLALSRKIRSRQAGDEVKIRVLRDGQSHEIEAVLADRSSDIHYAPQWNWEGEEWQAWQDDLKEQVESLGERLGRSYSFTLPEGSREMSFSVNWGRPKLGVQLVETTSELREHLGGSEDEGVLVSKVLTGTPAAKAGITVGDLIVSVDGDSVASVDELRAALEDRVGETFPVQVIRDHRRVSLDVTITEPEDFRPTGPQARLRVPAPRIVLPPLPPVPMFHPVAPRVAPAPPAVRLPPAPPAPRIREVIEV